SPCPLSTGRSAVFHSTLLCLAAVAGFADEPLGAPPLAPPVVLPGRVVKDKFVYSETAHVPFMRIVPSAQPGAPATERGYLIQSRQVASPVAGVRATDAAGKPIPADKIAERLKEETVVVVTYGTAVEERVRKAFKDGMVFLSFPPSAKKEDVTPKE